MNNTENKEKELNEGYCYYSKLLGRPFNTLDELKDAEEAKRLEIEKKKEQIKEKQADAKKVDDAYKHIFEIRKKAIQEEQEATEEFNKLRQEFIKKYGYWHTSYTGEDFDYGLTSINTLVNVMDAIEKFFR